MRRAPLLLTLALAALLALLTLWAVREARTRGPLYCLETRGQVWSLGAVPAGAVPGCPESRSYRQEVRSGFARVEQYTLRGWRPRALLPVFTAAGYVPQGQAEDAGGYTVFLSRAGERVQYVADRQPGGKTRITLSGRPAAR